MKKFFLLPLLLLPFLIACFSGDPTAAGVLLKVQKNYESHSSLSYSVVFRIKTFNSSDTLSYEGECGLVRNPSDTLFGGSIFNTIYTPEFKTGIEKYYDLDSIYVADTSKKVITVYDARHGEAFGLNGSFAYGMLTTYFLDAADLGKMVSDKANHLSLRPGNYNGKDCWVVSVHYPDDPPFSKIQKDIWVTRDSSLICKMTKSAMFQGNYQYDTWLISNIRFDGVTVSDLGNKFEKDTKGYSGKRYKAEGPDKLEPLPAGTTAPVIGGSLFPSGESVSLSGYKGKVVVTDFFYESCYPCILAIKHLVKLKKEFAGNTDLAIIGFDSHDGDEDGKRNMPNFIKRNSISYPVVLTGKRSDSLFNVHAYPTLYVIGRDGKIIYSQVGYADELMDSLRTVVKAALK